MKKIVFLLIICLVTISYAQNNTVKGIIVNSSDSKPLENVNIVNLNQVKGTTTNNNGEFEISAKANDTLHFSYLGFKSIKARVTNDWIKFGNTTIELTELALALEEVIVRNYKLTGYLAVDIANVPVETNYRYSISGLNTGYEAGKTRPSAVNRVLSAIFNPADFLHNLFGKKGKQMRKLKKMKQDDEIRTLLASRFDREMLLVLLEVEKIDLDEIIRECNYSSDFIRTANDLQVLDAISECYEEYKLLTRNRS